MAKTLVRESEYVVAWLVLLGGGAIGGAFFGGIAGFALGMVLGAAGLPLPQIRSICGAAGGLAGLAWSYQLFRIVVDRMVVRKIEARLKESAAPMWDTPANAGQ